MSDAFSLSTSSGRTLHGLIDWPKASGGLLPTVVIAHGFKGFLEWGFFPPLAALLRERGFAVIRFNFSGSGMQPGDELVTDLQAFEDNTYDREREDLLALLAAIGNELGPGRFDPENLGLVGHSRGGGASILAAADPRWRDRLKAVVTWASISRIDRVTPEQLVVWRRSGQLPVVNGRTGQELTLGKEMLAETENPPTHLDLLAAAGRTRAPWLIVQGTDDEAVPRLEADNLLAAAPSNAELLMIEGGSHTFGARHPFAGPTRELIQVFNATQTWLRRHLS